MSSTVIKVENLSKKYRLGVIGYGTLKDDLQSAWARLRGKEDPNAQIGKQSRLGQHGEFWALRDVSFDVQQGDRVGIIGRNGAGKSTLLKVLSRVTAPTSGSIKVKGRIASLLEVGTGFHPELTGRENIFLNGAILGMHRREIQRKFDEIVEFAGVNEFIDTPVKRYSSGMYVRLAFSVASNLDSDILIIDEVLSVGDAEFQQKCIGKMEDISKGQGRTILFVSHQINTVSSLCNKGILLANGVVAEPLQGIGNIISIYNKKLGGVSTSWVKEKDSVGSSATIEATMLFVSKDEAGDVLWDGIFSNNERVHISIGVHIYDIHPVYSIGIAVYDSQGNELFWSYLTDPNKDKWPVLSLGYNEFLTALPDHYLNEGDYKIELITSIHAKAWINEPMVSAPSVNFQIRGGLSTSEYWQERRPGVLAPVLTWNKSNSLKRNK